MQKPNADSVRCHGVEIWDSKMLLGTRVDKL